MEVNGGAPTDLQIQLSLHDSVTVTWCATIPLTPSGGTWTGVWTNQESTGDPRLLEIIRIGNETEGDCEIRPRQLFLEPPGNGAWASGAVAEAERIHRDQTRQAYYDKVVEADNTSVVAPEYYVIALAENLLLTQPQRVPGMTLVALESATLGSDTCEILNAILRQRNFTGGLDPDTWRLIHKSNLMTVTLLLLRMYR